jgi:hypothetical protein
LDASILRAEARANHRVKDRMFVLEFIPPGSVGAELGVYTGLFSSLLARRSNASRISFVDPWWTEFGEHYPDWGVYSDFGQVKTRAAYAAAQRRVLQHRIPNRFIEVSTSFEWLAAQPDESLDWIYVDTTHSYEGTKRELALLQSKLKNGGLIIGDDWQLNEGHPHHGVVVAVNEFLRHSDFSVIICGRENQWILRKGTTSQRPIVHAPPDQQQGSR